MYSKPAKPAATPVSAVNDQTVRTVQAADGKWLSIADAVEATQLSERTLRRYVKKGLIKARRIGKHSNSPVQLWITAEIQNLQEAEESAEDIVDVFEASVDGADENFAPDDAAPTAAPVEQLLRTITDQFIAKLDEQKELIFQMRGEIQEKDIQLRLLPDLQKKLEEKEKLTQFEATALQKQIEELQQENDRLRQEAAKAADKKGWWARLFSPAEPNT